MLRVGLVGAGWVAGEHFQAYLNNPETKIAAIAVRRPETAQEHMDTFGFSAEVFTDYQKMLDECGLDVVSICTPPNVHAEQTIQAAEAGCHMVIEKAVALNMDEMNQMRKAVNDAGVKTIVSFVLRWNSLFETIRSLLAAQAIGRVFYSEVDYYHGIGPWYGQYSWNIKKEIGGSSFLSAGCHAVDALRWFTGSEATEVTAYSTHSNNPDFGMEYDPTLVALIKLADGSIGKVASSLECVQPYHFPIRLCGDGGSILNNKFFSKSLMPGQTDMAEIPSILPDSGDVSHHPFQGQIDHFVECILTDTESHCNLEDAAKTHEICFAAETSAQEGQPVPLPLS